MESRIKHYYSVSSIIIGKSNEYQINFYAGDYLKKGSDSFKTISQIDQIEILSKIDFFIDRLPDEGINLLAKRGTDSNFLGYSFDEEESDYCRYAYLFFTNRTEIVELRGKCRADNFTGIVDGFCGKELEFLRSHAVFVNYQQEPMAYYSAFIY